MKVLLRSDVVHSPGWLNYAAMDNVTQTTKSFSALAVKRNTSDPPAFFQEGTAVTILLSTPDKSSEVDADVEASSVTNQN